MDDHVRAAVIEELREQAKLLRLKGRADMTNPFAAGILWSANHLDAEADALEARQSSLVDQS